MLIPEQRARADNFKQLTIPELWLPKNFYDRKQSAADQAGLMFQKGTPFKGSSPYHFEIIHSLWL